MSGRIEASNRRFGRVNLALKDIGNLIVPLNNVATHPILGYFLRKNGLATKLKTTTGSVYVNTNSLLSHLHSYNGIPAQFKKRTLSSIKIMIKSQGMTTSKTLDCSKIHGIYIKIQILKNPAFNVPLQNPVGNLQETAALSNTADAPSLANPTREIKEEGELLDGKRAGKWTITYPNGKKVSGNYHFGKKINDWLTTCPNGEKSLISYNFNGMCIRVRKFAADGKCTEDTHYKDGFRHGKWFKILANGTIEKGEYAENRKEGLWRIQHHTGETDEIHYQLGLNQGVGVRIHQNGDREVGMYFGDVRWGIWTITHPNGDREKGEYSEGERDGKWTTTYHNAEKGYVGFLKMKYEEYAAGKIQKTTMGRINSSTLKKVGNWVTTHENGDKVKKSYSHIDHRLNGPYIKTYAYGIKVSGNYHCGKKINDWLTTCPDGEKSLISYNFNGMCIRVREFAADGKCIEDTNYKDGSPHGKWFKILANGRVEDGQYAERYRREGLWRIQHHTGETDEIHYPSGSIQGTGVRIHQNGDREEGMYFGGVRWGIWTTTDKDGNLTYTIDYKARKILAE